MSFSDLPLELKLEILEQIPNIFYTLTSIDRELFNFFYTDTPRLTQFIEKHKKYIANSGYLLFDKIKIGEWIERTPRGKILSIANYHMGQLDGKYIKYKGKNIVKSGTYMYGKIKTGEWIKYDPHTRIRIIANYRIGKLHGEYIKYEGDDIVKSGTYVDGKFTGIKKYIYIDDMTYEKFQDSYTFVNGVKHGPAKIHFDEITFEEGSYKDGKRFGEWEIYERNKRTVDMFYDGELCYKYNYENGYIILDSYGYFTGERMRGKWNNYNEKKTSYELFGEDSFVGLVTISDNKISYRYQKNKYDTNNILQEVHFDDDYSRFDRYINGKLDHIIINNEKILLESTDLLTITNYGIQNYKITQKLPDNITLTTIYENNQLKELYYEKGTILINVHEKYHDNTKLKSQEFYEDDKIKLLTEFDELGKLIYMESYDKKDILKSKSEIVDGLFVTTRFDDETYWCVHEDAIKPDIIETGIIHKDGNVTITNYVCEDDVCTKRTATTRNPNGEIIKITTFYPTAEIYCEKMYSDNQLTQVIYYYLTGIINLLLTFKDGKKIGRLQNYPNGTIRNYRNYITKKTSYYNRAGKLLV